MNSMWDVRKHEELFDLLHIASFDISNSFFPNSSWRNHLSYNSLHRMKKVLYSMHRTVWFRPIEFVFPQIVVTKSFKSHFVASNEEIFVFDASKQENKSWYTVLANTLQALVKSCFECEHHEDLQDLLRIFAVLSRFAAVLDFIVDQLQYVSMFCMYSGIHAVVLPRA